MVGIIETMSAETPNDLIDKLFPEDDSLSEEDLKTLLHRVRRAPDMQASEAESRRRAEYYAEEYGGELIDPLTGNRY